ncbi:DHHW family protein [Halobacillus litoralis]|uniref:AlgX/AlgJ SGNH hydrolase-like domain-containing protein n=1 Tax=Halobacillus litoralis TaxID=45668 RepID=A0A410MFE1_9BACI|nr:DHHW family protein [Halobacillus litoralis]QAS53418.1 hypothetical protein HLI_15040 [Halobacillus litoralis]
MKKLRNALTSIGFVIVLFTIGLYMIFSPVRETSYIENRSLATAPPIEGNQIVNGEFMKRFEQFFTDQFPGRDVWLKTYLNIQSTLDKTFLLGYYVSEDAWITTEPDHSFPEGQLAEGAEHVNALNEELQNKGMDFYYINTPHKVTNMQFLLPDYIERGAYDQVRHYFLNSLDRSVEKMDMIEQFNEDYSDSEMKQLFFKTDHHWNSYGAFEGYRKIIEWLAEQNQEFSPVTEKLTHDAYERSCLSEKEFVGSFNRQLYLSVDTEERKCAFFPKDDAYDDFVVENEGERVDNQNIYGRAFHDTEEKVYYSTLHTTDFRELKITNPARPEGEKVLIIKDSYVNALSFLMAQQFQETTYYDPRHNKDRSLMEYIKNHDFDIVMVMYNDPSSAGAIYEFNQPPESQD